MAEITLADLRQAAAEARARAAAARIKSAEEEFAITQEKARKEASYVAGLRKLASNASLDWRDRAAASHMLAVGLGVKSNVGGLHDLKDSADRFALRRLGERSYQRLWNELRPRVPSWYPGAQERLHFVQARPARSQCGDASRQKVVVRRQQSLLSAVELRQARPRDERRPLARLVAAPRPAAGPTARHRGR